MEQPNIDELKASLLKHAQAFDELLRLIPPKFYLPEEHAQILNNRYMKNTKKDTDTKKKSEQRKARATAKSARLDPDNAKTVQDMQSAKLDKQAKTKSKPMITNKARTNGTGAAAAGGDSISGDEWEDTDDTEDAPSATSMAIDLDGLGEEAVQKGQTNDAVKPMPPAQSINDLRDRLQARIQSLRQKRKAPEDDGSREALLERRMKRRETTKEARAKAKKSASGVAVKEQILGKNTPGSSDNGDGSAGSGESSVKNNVLFGKLTSVTPKKKKSIQVRQQLANVESKKKSLEELRKVDAGKADELEEKDKWNKALGQAKGEKVKDDVKLLRKAVRREDQQKRKSSREWTDRKKAVKDKIKERTDKREANIKVRIDAKKMKKQGKSKKSIARVIKGSKEAAGGPKNKNKKGSSAQKARPGFEGKASKKK
ncbi:hypothetical protein EV175_001193 [Coemansia sp. RSA 1933]|nr:hypothetical protein EV175_001193 [Coemansia sp. RSA 1933]